MAPKANTKAKVTKPAAATKKAAAAKAMTAAAVPKKKPAAKKTTTAAEKPAATRVSKRKAAQPVAKSTTTDAEKPARATKRKATDDTVPPPAKKTKATPAPSKRTTKRKADDDVAAPPAKKTKPLTKGPVINQMPDEIVKVYVFGEGTAGELGLGTAKNAVDVKRPRLNPNLDPNTVGVVQISAGGMHVVALTRDNKILTWGVNDQGALGRDTQWDGGLKDMDAAAEGSDSDSEDEEDDNGLNPKECTPGEVDFSTTEVAEGTRWVQVTAGDSCTFALTDDGRVYGWGTFRGNEGTLGFNPTTETAFRPILIPDLKKITSIAAGANHALALNSTGSVFAWGSGQQMQLGRRIVERTKLEGLRPREFGLPKGAKKGIVSIATGQYHSFAIDRAGNVFGWGLNSYGETGIPENAGEDDAAIMKPKIIDGLKDVTSIEGGAHHSIAATAQGDCVVWGRCDSAQAGIDKAEIGTLPSVMRDDKQQPRLLLEPTKVSAIRGKVTQVAAGPDHCHAVTDEGHAWSWGFSACYQTGLGTTEEVTVAQRIENTAVKAEKLVGAMAGGQYGIIVSKA